MSRNNAVGMAVTDLQLAIERLRFGWRNDAEEHRLIAADKADLLAALNDLGELVGWVCRADTSCEAQLWRRNEPRPIDPEMPF